MRNIIKSYGERIRQRRAVLGLLQPQLAALSGVNVRTIQLLEQGNVNPTLDTLLKVTEPLGLTLELNLAQPAINMEA